MFSWFVLTPAVTLLALCLVPVWFASGFQNLQNLFRISYSAWHLGTVSATVLKTNKQKHSVEKYSFWTWLLLGPHIQASSGIMQLCNLGPACCEMSCEGRAARCHVGASCLRSGTAFNFTLALGPGPSCTAWLIGPTDLSALSLQTAGWPGLLHSNCKPV